MKRCWLTIISLLCFVWAANAQTDCYFKIDEEKVGVYNEHLDYFVKKFQRDTFVVSTDKNLIPEYVQRQLYCIFKDTIANSNEEYQATCTVTDHLPWRRLNFFASSKNIYLINYNKGGFGVWTGIIIMEFAKQGIVVNDELKLIKVWMNQGSFPMTYSETVKRLKTYRNINDNSVIDVVEIPDR
jgi:hypothetical protein